MYINFDTLPSHSRVWIYQADRNLNSEEESGVTNSLTQFCEGWNAHGQPLRTSFKIMHDRFIILGADEDFNLPSGCSIDSSVRLLKELQQQIGVNFFDRTRIAFWSDEGVVVHPTTNLKALFEDGSLNANTPTFDNLVPSKGDFDHRWRVASKNTWLVKYLPKSALAS